MRKTCLDQVYQLAKHDERICFVGSDLGVGVLDEFRTKMPDRFFMEGINEANVVGLASGLAADGRIVYVNTIATFLTRRCYEQVVLDLALHNANVRLIGNGGGFVYAPLGPTHEATEDIAIMRAIPRMGIVAPADEVEMRNIMPQTVDHDGPLYIRLAKGYDPVVTPEHPGLEIGQSRVMREGSDALILTTGITLSRAQKAASRLALSGLNAAILHAPTIKPFDTETFLSMADKTPVVVTVEEHSEIGGLGSCVAEIIAEADFVAAKRFRRIGIPDVFADDYGSQNDLMARYGITADRIVETVQALTDVPQTIAV